MKVPAAEIYFPIEDRKEILLQMEEALVTGQLTLGKHGLMLEEQFKNYVGCKHAIAVNSGTSAIEIALRIFGVEGKEVLVPTNTFIATAAAVRHAGGKVRFVDADRETFSISMRSLRSCITRETVGMIVVHIAGIVTPQMPEIVAFCRDHGLFMFEDAAHAIRSSLNGTMAGAFGQASSFSLYPTKVITSGEGGIICTSNQRIYEESLIYRDQGKAGFLTNVHTRLGSNWRLSEPHAILGVSQFKRLEVFIVARSRIAEIYDGELAKNRRIQRVPIPAGSRSNYYKYLAVLEPGIDRSALKKHLREKYEVGLSGEVYEVPCHKQPVFQSYDSEPMPVAEDLCARHICLPISARMSDAQAYHVIESLEKALLEI